MVDDSLVKEVERTLLEFKEKKEAIETRTRALIFSEGDVTVFAAWWAGIQSQLVEVIPGRSVYASDPDDQWDDSESEWVVIEMDRVRWLLKSMGLAITCSFRKKTRQGREHVLDHARLSATVEYLDRSSGTWRSRPP